MKRKELEVGKEYFTSATPLDEVSYWNESTQAKVRVEDVEHSYEGIYRSGYYVSHSTDLADFRKTSGGQGILVSYDDVYRGVTTRKFRVVPARLIRAPYEEAKKVVTERIRRDEEYRKACREEKARQEKHYEDVVKPALNALVSELGQLANTVTGEKPYIYFDTELKSLPLDVIEVLTLIVREANNEEVSA
jgi:hypothetical protein